MLGQHVLSLYAEDDGALDELVVLSPRQEQVAHGEDLACMAKDFQLQQIRLHC